MKSILGLGNALVDILATIIDDNLLKKYNLPKGSMQHVDEVTGNNILTDIKKIGYEQVTGGSAANTLYGTACLGLKSAFIGKIGDDELGQFFRADQEQNNIIPSLLTGESSTGRAMVLINNDAERTFATYLGAAIEMNPDDLVESLFEGYNYFHIEGYLVQNHELVRKAVKIARNRGMCISLDMASYNVVEQNHDFLREILQDYVDVVFANEDEARMFTGEEPERAVKDFAKVCKIAVVKIGEKGSLAQSGNRFHRISPIKATAVDATGAGDLYASGFIYGLANDLSLDKCGAIGSLCAGKVVEVIGPKMDNQKWEVIHAEIQKIIAT